MRHRRIHVATAADRTSQAVVGGDQVFLQGCTGATLDGEDFVGRGDPAAQAEQAMQNVRTLLEAAGGRVEDICMVTNYTTRHADRAQVYPVIARHLAGVNPVSTGLVVQALSEPHIDFEIDAWAVIPHDRERGHERFRLTNARGGFLMPSLDFGNAKIVRANDHLFLQGQTGMTLDGRDFVGAGDPALQAETAMENVRALLADADADLHDICKVTTYLTDPSYRELVQPVLARYLGDVRPAMTNTVVRELARPELNLEIDVFAMVAAGDGDGRQRLRSSVVDGLPVSQVVRSGEFVFLQGQTGRGEVTAQADQAMQNVAALLDEAGAGAEDICKVTAYVTDPGHRAAIEPVLRRHLRDVHPVLIFIAMEGLADPEHDVVIDVFAVVANPRRASA